jgi:hypothetical protein
LLALGIAASDAMLWRALVSTTKRTLKPAGKLSESDQKEFQPVAWGKLPRFLVDFDARSSSGANRSLCNALHSNKVVMLHYYNCQVDQKQIIFNCRR